MPDIIQLLPESIANQIAAGEVIQRPASVIKELLDNAVDAGATEITVILKDAGKTLIQVQDNGSGMSPTDARMSLERHATSKLRTADDLFDIRTMGFRGEALASIAAIAHLEIRTKRAEDTVGTRLLIEASEVKVQEGCQCPVGTTIMVRHLFYNVPARRKFLKSDPVEMRHLLDEFHHLALAFENIRFSLFHNDQEIYVLPTGSLRQRILNIFGKKNNELLVPVEEETNYVHISGYIGKPKLAKKTRGEQYLFVNRRFIRSPYLYHAVKSAYEDILPEDQFPFFVLFLGIEADKIDVNVHPTKQEIKFEDERIIYNYVRVACRHALGKYSIMPSLDFDQVTAIERASATGTTTASASGQPLPPKEKSQEKENIRKWESLLQSIEGFSIHTQEEKTEPSDKHAMFSPTTSVESEFATASPVQLWQRYILVPGHTDLIVIDQRAAHERILYESLMKNLAEQSPSVQKLLWPETIQPHAADALLLEELLPHLRYLGFDIESFGHGSVIVHGLPAVMTGILSAQQAIEDILIQYREDQQLAGLKPIEKIAISIASAISRKRGEILNTEEMRLLLEALLSAENPYTSPTGRKTFVTMSREDIFRKFQS